MSDIAFDDHRHQLVAGVAEARAVLRSLADVPLFGLSDSELVAQLGEIQSVVFQAEELLSRAIGEVDARGAGRSELGARSTKKVLMGRLRMTPSQAAHTVKLAQALRDPELAETSRAFAAGAFGRQHARRIVEAMGMLPDEATQDVRDVVQQELIKHAGEFDADAVVGLGREALKRVDPELSDRVLAEQLEREEREAARERVLWFHKAGAGSVRFGGRLDTASARILLTALDPLAKPTPTEKDGSEVGAERRTAGQRRADALVELARRNLQAGDLPKHGGEATQLVLTMKLDDLTKGINAAYLPTGEAISASQARLLACDANLIPAVLDSANVPLDIGRGRRPFDGKLRKGLELRDGGCAFPFCDVPVAWCDAHHIQPWSNNGVTSLDKQIPREWCLHRALPR